MPKMKDINVQKSRFFKIADLEEATGQPWGKSNLAVVIESASVGEYPGEEGKAPEAAYFLKFRGFEKELGCNLTNRNVLQSIVGDEAEWDTRTLAGLHLQLYAEYTSMGPGMRVRYDHAATNTNAAPASNAPSGESRFDDVPPPSNDPIHDQEPGI